MRSSMHLIVAALALLIPHHARAAEPIKTAILTGDGEHNWRYTSRMHKDTLESTGEFTVRIFDDPRTLLHDAPATAGYQLFVVDSAAATWGNAAQNALSRRIAAGAGLVIVGPSCKGFRDWKDWAALCSLVYREGSGQRFQTADVRMTSDRGPVTTGFPTITAHPDVFLHGLRNASGTNYGILAVAALPKQVGGDKYDEPVAWFSKFSDGRVFHTVLGNVVPDEIGSKESVCDPGFKALLCRGAQWAATGESTLPAIWTDARPHNHLTPEEKEAGWELAFDGNTFGEWRGFKREKMPEQGWIIEQGCIRHVASAGGGDIVLPRDLGDFEFSCEWKVAPGANSGIFYRFDEKHDAIQDTGPESQVLDNARHNDGKSPKTSAGSAYALYACAFDVARPAREFNSIRIVAKGTHVEHWLNGFKVVEFDTASAEFLDLVSKSKFKDRPDYAKLLRGRIGLQDHGDDVWFRNLKVRAIEE